MARDGDDHGRHMETRFNENLQTASDEMQAQVAAKWRKAEIKTIVRVREGQDKVDWKSLASSHTSVAQCRKHPSINRRTGWEYCPVDIAHNVIFHNVKLFPAEIKDVQWETYHRGQQPREISRETTELLPEGRPSS